MRRMALALVLAVSTMTLGCSKETPGGSTKSAEPSTEGKGPIVTKFRIGPVVDGDGIVTRETDAFKQGEAIHLSFVVKNVPKNTPIRVVWRDSARRDIAEEQKPLPSDGAVSFEMKDAGNLASGEYVVEFSRGEASAPGGWGGLGTKPFTMGPKPPL